MPALSPTMEQGNLAEWKVKEGDTVGPGDVLADIETDKATMGFETQEDGVIAKLLVSSGAKDIAVGKPLLVVVESEDDVAAFAEYSEGSPSDSGGAASASAPAHDATESAGQSAAHGSAPAAKRSSRLGPAARYLLHTHSLSADDITPTGPNGIVTKADVLAAVAGGAKPKRAPSRAADASGLGPAPSKDADILPKAGLDAEPTEGKSAPAPAADTPVSTAASSEAAGAARAAGRVRRGQERYKDVPVSNMRRVIAKRLLESKLTTPALYIAADARLDALAALRAALKETGVKASVNDFVLKACALALRAVPAACAGWDAKRETAVQYTDVDISVAVATDAGLITPIVKGADGKSLQQIGKDVKELAGRARENKLKPDEFTGGSFTISNLGMFGISEFSAIINPPQACILAIGGTQQRYRLTGGRLAPEAYMRVTLSADNRVVDEETAAAFLKSFAFHVENPALLLA